ncbi:hypothetical protein COU61_03470 [Candidatus Pacearchaeota archaeon CG10_big_fil_rev_8_21_14_0_10_35_13]|nr:MAG: hypothetical protein COU61_03470 [Candidatus Pacearchaeota archaeon CG10_big_fil_rev_8_21_14_0_10_35_13]
MAEVKHHEGGIIFDSFEEMVTTLAQESSLGVSEEKLRSYEGRLATRDRIFLIWPESETGIGRAQEFYARELEGRVLLNEGTYGFEVPTEFEKNYSEKWRRPVCYVESRVSLGMKEVNKFLELDFVPGVVKDYVRDNLPNNMPTLRKIFPINANGSTLLLDVWTNENGVILGIRPNDDRLRYGINDIHNSKDYATNLASKLNE